VGNGGDAGVGDVCVVQSAGTSPDQVSPGYGIAGRRVGIESVQLDPLDATAEPFGRTVATKSDQSEVSAFTPCPDLTSPSAIG